jgi:hypothetical protein
VDEMPVHVTAHGRRKRALDSKEAGEMLGTHPETLANWRYKGIGPAYTRIGRAIRYLEDDLLRYLAQNRVDPEAVR